MLDEHAFQRPGEDQHPHRLVGEQRVDRRLQLGHHGCIHVTLGRIVETDDGNGLGDDDWGRGGIAPLDFDPGHARLFRSRPAKAIAV